jgi:hypothetical protein
MQGPLFVYPESPMRIAPPAPEQYIETLRSRIVEGRTLNPYQYRPVVIPLQVTLGASTLQGNASFTIPSNQKLILRQFIPHIVPLSVSSPLDAVSGVYNVGVPAAGDVLAGGAVEDLLLAKAMNCRVSITLASSTFQLFPRLAFSLADLMRSEADVTTLFDMPGPLPQGTNIYMNASLSDPSAAGSDTQYGIVFGGAYVSVESN